MTCCRVDAVELYPAMYIESHGDGVLGITCRRGILADAFSCILQVLVRASIILHSAAASLL